MALFDDSYIFEKEPHENIQISKDITIKTVNSIPLLRSFFDITFKLYEGNEYYVPMFWSELKDLFKTNELFWKHAEGKLFVAFQNEKPIARIGGFIDHNVNEGNDSKVGFFGFFETTNDYPLAKALIDQVSTWLKRKGITVMQGPINGRVDIGSGFVIKGFDHLPYLIGHTNLPYYADLVEQYGMKKERDLVSYYIDLNKEILPNLKKSVKRCKENNIRVRPFNRWKFKKEMKWWVKMLMEEFEGHFGYTAVEEEEVLSRFGIKQLRWIVDPKLFLVAEVNGEPIGFRWSLPDYNQLFKDFNGKFGALEILKVLLKRRHISRGRFIIMGIKKKYRGMGIGTYLNYYTIKEMQKRKYTSAEYGWIDETNIASCKAGEKICGELYKIYRVYSMNI